MTVKIPNIREAELAIQDENTQETLLDIFISECTPAEFSAASTFRWHLQRLLDWLARVGVHEVNYSQLRHYLLDHEDEIANGERDFGRLMGVFIDVVGRDPL